MKYPWQAAQWQVLNRWLETKAFPHAVLFTGRAGIGKADCAQHFIRSFFCQAKTVAPDLLACCGPCRLIAGHVHPNILQLVPEGKANIIKIEQIRLCIDFINQTALSGAYRFVLIQDAHTMNHHAANALLKTLEEPAPDAMLILIADQLGKLPATIISRCQRIHFSPPQDAVALAWLEAQSLPEAASLPLPLLLTLAEGAPLLAKQWAESEYLGLRQAIYTALAGTNKAWLKQSAQWAQWDALCVVNLFIHWAVDVLRLQLGIESSKVRNSDFGEALLSAQARCSKKSLLAYLQHLHWYERQIVAGMNLNKQLFIESMVIDWLRLPHIPAQPVTLAHEVHVAS